jgi:putative membrane protein
MMHGWYDDGGGSWGAWLIMSMVMIAVWAILILALVMVFRGGGWERRPVDHAPRSGARELLDERFARGEIDAEEYHARRAALSSDGR